MANEKDKKQHTKKANDAYNDVANEGFDLQALIAASKSALATKQATNQKKKKNVKKTLMQAAQEKIKLQAQQIAEMEKQAIVIKAENKNTEKEIKQTKVDNAKGRGFLYGGRAQQFLVCKKALDSAETKILEATAYKLFTKIVEESIAKDLAKASKGVIYFSPNAGKAKAEYNRRIGIANKALGKLRAENKTLPSAPTNSPLNPAAPATPAPATQTGSPQRMLEFFGGWQSRGTRMSPLGSVLAGHGTVHPASSLGTQAVTALQNVSDSVDNEAKTIKEVSRETESWLGKKLSWLGRSWRSTKAGVEKGGSFLVNMLALAALLPSVILPALAGINDALEEKFGKHYVKDFLVGLWDKSIGFLSDKIKDILGIKDKGKENAAKYKELTKNDGPHTPEEARNIALDTQYGHNAPSKPSIFGDDPKAASSPGLNAIRWTMAEQRGDSKGPVAVGGVNGAKSKLQEMVDNAPAGTLDAKTARELTAMGVVVAPGATAPTTPVVAVPGSNDTKGGSTGTLGMRPNITGGGVKAATLPNDMTPSQMGVYEMVAHGAR